MTLHHTYVDDPRESYGSPTEEGDDVPPSPEQIATMSLRLKERLGDEWDETVSIEAFLNHPTELPPFPEFPVEVGFEDFLPTVSQEDFQQRLRYVLDKFLQWVKAVGRWLKEAFSSTNLELVTAEELTRQLGFDLRDMPLTVRGHLTVGSDTPRLSLRYRPVSHAGELVGALASFDNHMKAYYGYANTVLTRGVREAMGVLKDGQTSSATLIGTFMPISPQLLLKSGNIDFKQADDLQYGWVSPPLLNNIRLLLTVPESVTTLPELNLVGCQVARAMTTPGPSPKTMTIPRFDRRQAQRLQAQMLTMIETIKAQCGNQQRQQQNRLINDIETLIADLRRHGRDEDVVSVQQRIALARTLIEWVSQPYRSLAANGLRVTKAARRLCYQNLRSVH